MGRRNGDVNQITEYFRKIAADFRTQLSRTSLKSKIMFLGISTVFLISLIILIVPSRNKHKRLQEQKELETIIVSGGDSIEVEIDDNAVFDFYDDEDDNIDFFGEASEVVQSEEEDENETRTESSKKPKKTEITGLGMLKIDKIDLRIPVAAGASKTSLKVAAGHVNETAQIGSKGNAVVAAHRSYTKGQFFNRLDELVLGDKVEYTTKDGTFYVFKVIEIETLEPSDSSFFDIRLDKNDLTLYTCTPIRVASHRLALRCELVETIK